MKLNDKRRELQEQAVAALAEAEFNAFAILPTGSGKGWILVECLRRLNPKGRVWYLCDSEDNRDTTFKEELKKWGAGEWIDRIEFYCYQSAYKLERQAGELMLCDEADFGLSPEYKKSFDHEFKHKILVSATLEGEKRFLAEAIVPIVFERTLREVEDAGILNGARHYLVNYLLSPAENKTYLQFNKDFVSLLAGEGRTRTKREEDYLENLTIKRKHFLSGLESSRNVCRKLLKQLYAEPENKILVFCGLSEQADTICRYSYHSESVYNFLPAFDAGDIRVLSVVAKADRGLNLKGVNNIVFEAPSKSVTKMVQRSGRGRRLAVDEILDIYYLVPYFKTKYGMIKPTVVKKWIEEATGKMNFNPIIYKFQD